MAPGSGSIGIDTPLARKYHLFKRLLGHNRDALGAMADLEQAYYGGRVPGLNALRAKYDALATSARELVSDLQELSEGGYAGLEDVLQAIGGEVAPLLRTADATSGDLVVPLDSVTAEAAGSVGGKALHLATMPRLTGVSIPRGFVVTTSGFRRLVRQGGLEEAIEDALLGVTLDAPASAEAASQAIRPLILRATIPEEVAHRIFLAFDKLGGGNGHATQVAVRSSAVGEDSGASFAGQYATVLGVTRDALLDAYRSVLASKYSPEAILYRLRFGLDDCDTPMAVLAMEMIDARTSGVVYTRDPVGGDPNLMRIAATWGLGERLVSGEGGHDVFQLDRRTGDLRRRNVQEKAQRPVLADNGGVCLAATPSDDARQACVDDDTLRSIGRLGLALEEHFGSPQDVEWSLDRRGALHVLQSRPLNLTSQAPPPVAGPKDPALHPILLQGVITASFGTASGKVVVVHGRPPADLPDEAILVVKAASPDYAVLIGKVRGIVAETGSATSHLACVAREFGVPALFDAGALKIAYDIMLFATFRAISPPEERGR